jgi:hypothetical protein
MWDGGKGEYGDSSLRCAQCQNDKQKVKKQIPSLRCGMTNQKNNDRDSGYARMTNNK